MLQEQFLQAMQSLYSWHLLNEIIAQSQVFDTFQHLDTL